MSRIGKQPVLIPDKIKVSITDKEIVFENDKKEKLTVALLPFVKVKLENNQLTFQAESKSKQARSNWGTIRSLSQNAILGLTEGFKKTLILEGVGYRIKKEGEDLNLALGFSHPVKYKKVAGINFEVDEKANTITISGFDKALVGQVAAEIRAFRKVEPYKGKGFRYSDEVVRRKAGKKAIGASA